MKALSEKLLFWGFSENTSIGEKVDDTKRSDDVIVWEEESRTTI